MSGGKLGRWGDGRVMPSRLEEATHVGDGVIVASEGGYWVFVATRRRLLGICGAQARDRREGGGSGESKGGV